MRIVTAGLVGATIVATLGSASLPAEAKMPVEMPGGDAFETRLNQQIEDANAAAERERANQPALAQSNDADVPEPAPREVVTIDKNLSGVPGDEKFEAAFAAWLERQNEELSSELAREPIGLGKMR